MYSLALPDALPTVNAPPDCCRLMLPVPVSSMVSEFNPGPVGPKVA